MTQRPTPFEALQEAVRRAVTQTAFAEICGISQPAVWKMLQSAKKLTAEYVIAVEAATGVSRHYLRPDIYPPRNWADVPPMDETFAPVGLTPPARMAPARRRRAEAVAQA